MTTGKPTCGDFALSPMIYFLAFTVSLQSKILFLSFVPAHEMARRRGTVFSFFFFLFALSGGNEALSEGGLIFQPRP